MIIRKPTRIVVIISMVKPFVTLNDCKQTKPLIDIQRFEIFSYNVYKLLGMKRSKNK